MAPQNLYGGLYPSTPNSPEEEEENFLRMHNLYYNFDDTPAPNQFLSSPSASTNPYLLNYNDFPAGMGNVYDPLTLDFSALSLAPTQDNMQRMRIQSAARATLPPLQQQNYNLLNGTPYNSPRRLETPSRYYDNSRRLNEAMEYINQSQRELAELLRNSYYNPHFLAPEEASSARILPPRGNPVGGRTRQRPNFASASLQEMRGKILSVAKDQYGCRFLQGKIEEGNPEDIQMIFMEIKDHICGLMLHQFGNYLIQKFLEVCNPEQTTHVLLMVINDELKFTEICVDMYGTRVVQSLIEHLTTQEQIRRMISALRRIAVALTKSMNGHHVIQHCLKFLSVEDNQHIMDVVADNCLDIATDKSGCCVLQQCLEHAHGEPRKRLIAELTSNALLLSQHPFGNYVVQYILGLKIPQATADILSYLTGNYVGLCMDKYGSNVVEKCLKESQELQRILIIEEIIYSPNFLRVLQDPYGNYVAQKALDTCKGALLVAMTTMINRNAPNLHSHPHGKRVLERTLRVSRPGITYNM